MKVGIDILENERFNDILDNNAKLSKIFTTKEIDYFNTFTHKLSHITGNFCAKEAFVKALGTGFSNGLTPIDIEILHDKNKVPYVNLNNLKIKSLLGEIDKVEISISHSVTISTAICIIYN